MKKDVVYNLLSIFFPTAILQLIILPFINAELNVEVYGLVVVVLAALNTVPSIIGNSLCNARQLLEGEYRTKCQTGDFWAIVTAL